MNVECGRQIANLQAVILSQGVKLSAMEKRIEN